MATIVITGANRGIGLELTRQYMQNGDTVYAACRKSAPDLDATGANVVTGVDVTDRASLKTLAAAVGGAIDVLIANAGTLTYGRYGAVDDEAVMRQFNVNSLGPLRTTEELDGLLKDGSKVCIITSRMGSIADNGSGGAFGYRASKAAVNAIGKSLSIELAPRGIAVGLFHPGWVRTEMGGPNGLIDAPESATNLRKNIDALSTETTGAFLHIDGTTLPW